MRILLPEEFGVIAKIYIVLTFFNIFLDLGYSQAIIQQKDSTKESLSSHFYLGTLIGFFLGCILYISSPFIANYFDNPELEIPFKLFSITLFIGGSVLVHRTLLFKEMQFKKLAIIDITSLIISGIIAISLALNGWGFMAIVIQLFSNSIIQAILYWAISSFRPARTFKLHHIRKTTTFSLYIFFAEIVNYISNILDQFLTALYFNNATLGLYNRSVSLIKNTAIIIPSTYEAVLYPLFSKLEHNSSNNQNEIMIRTSGIVSFIFTPIILIYFFFAEHFVLFVLGENWFDIIPFTKILALTSILFVSKFGTSLLLSKAKTKELFYLNLINKSILISAILIGIQYGLIQVLYGILIGEIIIRFFSLFVFNKLINFDIIKYLKHFTPPLIIGFLFVYVLYMLSKYLHFGVLILLPLILIYALYIIVSIYMLNTQYAKDTKLLYSALIKSNK